MTTPNGKEAPKGAPIPRIGKELDARERFLAWLRHYATFLSIGLTLIIVVIGANALLWQTTSTRFNDTTARIDDTKADVNRVQTNLANQIHDVKSSEKSVIRLISGRPVTTAPPKSPANTLPNIPAHAAIKSFPWR